MAFICLPKTLVSLLEKYTEYNENIHTFYTAVEDGPAAPPIINTRPFENKTREPFGSL